jgi:hypothetical protein
MNRPLVAQPKIEPADRYLAPPQTMAVPLTSPDAGPTTLYGYGAKNVPEHCLPGQNTSTSSK